MLKSLYQNSLYDSTIENSDAMHILFDIRGVQKIAYFEWVAILTVFERMYCAKSKKKIEDSLSYMIGSKDVQTVLLVSCNETPSFLNRY